MALSAKGAIDLLRRIPTALFPIALGLSGLGSTFHFAHQVFSIELFQVVSLTLLILGGLTLALDILLYLIKLLRARSAVLEDFSEATRANLIAPGFMAAMVIGGTLHNYYPQIVWIWLIGTIGHVVLLINFVGYWLTHDYKPEALNPTWFLPAAGIMTAPMTWPGYVPIEWPVFMLGVGSTLWIMLLPLVFRRLVFEPAVAAQLRPTLCIIAAPFGLAAGAVMTLFPQAPNVVPALFLSGGTFFVLVFIFQFRFFAHSGISLSWWATTFPIATLSAGFLRISSGAVNYFLIAGTSLLLLACLTTCFASLATIRAAWCTCLKTVGHTEHQIAAMQGRS